MPNLAVKTITPRTKLLLDQGQGFQILNVFESSCNLANSDGDVLSLVTSGVGPGPFSVVIEPVKNKFQKKFNFNDHINSRSEIQRTADGLVIDDLRIATNSCHSCWSPRPDWENIKPEQMKMALPIIEDKAVELASVESLVTPLLKGEYRAFHHQNATAAWEKLSKGIEFTDYRYLDEGAVRLAGLGSGLTPAGDDLLMGIIYSLWVNNQNDSMTSPIDRIAQLAGGRTNTLSRAWLIAASLGEAGEAWHDLVRAIISGLPSKIEEATRAILEIGSSSGADAMAGFVVNTRLLNRLVQK